MFAGRIRHFAFLSNFSKEKQRKSFKFSNKMGEYIRVAEDELVPEDAIELPSDEDGSIMLSTIQAQFPGSTGLRFRNEETQTWRGVRLGDGVLYPPPGGWGNVLYIVVSNKTADSSSKRKYEESPTAKEPNPKIIKNWETDESYVSDLIILGLSWKAKEQDLEDYFSRFGELAYHEVKRSQTTGQSRGFGFIRFKDSEVAKNVLSRPHTILDRRVDIRESKGKDDNTPKKVFIGRLPNNCNANDVREYFEKYGAISDVYIPQPFRQFGFVTFSSGEVAREVLTRNHVINGVRINVTMAEPKANKGGNPGAGMQSPLSGGYGNSGGGGGARAGYGWNGIPAYGGGDSRSGGGSLANQMNAMWNLAAMAQGMGGLMGTGMANAAGGIGSAGMGSGMGGMNHLLAQAAGAGGMGASQGIPTSMVGGVNTSGAAASMVGASAMDSSGMGSGGQLSSDAVNYALWNRENSRS